jgi:hypothetical protein
LTASVTAFFCRLFVLQIKRVGRRWRHGSRSKLSCNRRLGRPGRFSYSAVNSSIHLLDNQLALLLRDVLRDGAAHNRRAHDPNMRLLMLRSRKYVSPSTALSPRLIYQHNAWVQT